MPTRRPPTLATVLVLAAGAAFLAVLDPTAPTARGAVGRDAEVPA